MGKKSRNKQHGGPRAGNGGTQQPHADAGSRTRGVGSGSTNQLQYSPQDDIPECYAHLKKMFWKPGTTNSADVERRAKKDVSRIYKAQTRYLQEDMRKALGQLPKARELNLESIVHSLSPLELVGCKSFLDWAMSQQARWDRLFGEIQQHEPLEEWQAIFDKADSIIKELSQKRSQLGLDRERLLAAGMVAGEIWEHHAYNMRAQALLRGLGDPKRASEDLTISLAIHQGTFLSKYGTISPRSAKILYDRAECFKQLGEFKNAIVDLKAACAAVREIGEEAFQQGPFSPLPEASVYLLLAVMALKKIEEGAARPFYSDSERDGIMKEFGLFSYNSSFYHCAQCKKGPTESRLLNCSRCHLQWYCCKEHQVSAWKDFHCRECVQSCSIQTIPGDLKDLAEEALEKDGYWCSSGFLGQPEVFVRDPNSGRIFDPLTNWDLHVVPPERAAVIEILMSRSADKTDGKQFLWHVKGELRAYFPHEATWGRIVADLFLKRDDAHVEETSTKLIDTIEGVFPNISKERAWMAVFFLVSGYSSRSWALHSIGKSKSWGIKREVVFGLAGGPAGEFISGEPFEAFAPEFERAIDDASEGLSYVQLLNQWTENLGSATISLQRLYVKKLEALLLMHRGVLKKLKRDFDGAVNDLRACMSIIRRFSFAAIDKTIMFTRLGSGETCLGNALFHCQMALTLQKVAPEGQLHTPLQTPPPRPLFSAKERRALQVELGLEMDLSSPGTMLTVGNKGMGDADRWAFDHYGVFGTYFPIPPSNKREEWRIIVPDMGGRYFEALSNCDVNVMESAAAAEWQKTMQAMTDSIAAAFGR